MANKEFSKKLYWILGSVIIIGGITTFLLLRRKKNREQEEMDVLIQTPTLPTVTKSSSNSNLPSTPFFNKEQGDKFRKWVNQYYPKYAKSIDLDPSGDFNNIWIKKA